MTFALHGWLSNICWIPDQFYRGGGGRQHEHVWVLPGKPQVKISEQGARCKTPGLGIGAGCAGFTWRLLCCSFWGSM